MNIQRLDHSLTSDLMCEIRPMLAVGNKVIYPCQGPCLIGSVVERIVDDRPMMFYQLLILNNGGGDLFVPVDNVEAVGIRPLLKKSEILKLLDKLKEPSRSADNRSLRARDNLKLLTSGSAFALAEIVESLTELSETKALSFGDSSILERAKRLLICEIAEVMGETQEEAEERVEQALKAGKEERKPVRITRKTPTSDSKYNGNDKRLSGYRDQGALSGM